jgi:Protein of unknown function (DUF3592)
MLSQQALLWTTVAAAVCGLFALLLLRSLIKGLRRVAASRAWSMTAGEVIASALDMSRSHTTDDEPDCAANIRYRYRVADKDYESASLNLGVSRMMPRGAAAAYVARYPVGAHVDVTYDPTAPENAALEPGNAQDLTAQIVFLVVFAAIASVLGTNAIAGKAVTTAGGFPLWGFLLPVGAFLAGSGAVAMYFMLRRRAIASAAWPTAIGKITISTVDTETLREEDRDDDDRSSRQRIETMYRPVINYVYRVNGRDYFGSGLTADWSQLHGSPEVAQKIVDAYPVGHDVAVYYDPARPSTAVLTRGKEAVPTFVLVVGAIFLSIGVLMTWGFLQI